MMQGENMRFTGIRQFPMGKSMMFLGLFFIAGLFLTAFLSELMPMVFPGMETVANLKLTLALQNVLAFMLPAFLMALVVGKPVRFLQLNKKPSAFAVVGVVVVNQRAVERAVGITCVIRISYKYRSSSAVKLVVFNSNITIESIVALPSGDIDAAAGISDFIVVYNYFSIFVQYRYANSFQLVVAFKHNLVVFHSGTVNMPQLDRNNICCRGSKNVVILNHNRRVIIFNVVTYLDEVVEQAIWIAGVRSLIACKLHGAVPNHKSANRIIITVANF